METKLQMKNIQEEKERIKRCLFQKINTQRKEEIYYLTSDCEEILTNKEITYNYLY